MKTAAQLFTSSYLQPNNIDTEFESGGAAVREREKQERKKEKKYDKKVLERVEENVAHKKIRKNLRFSVCSCSCYFPSISARKVLLRLHTFFYVCGVLCWAAFDSNENFHFFLKTQKIFSKYASRSIIEGKLLLRFDSALQCA
jgi:hypothetical protein